MRKGGFNMYLTKEKSSIGLYKNYEPKFTNHKDVEIEAYIAYTVGNDITKKMKSTVHSISAMIVRDFSKGGN